MSYLTGREAFFEVARSEGVKYLFANPGTTELQIFDELAEGQTGVELILALQEAAAVAAADGYAQATRRPSLVNLHIAPGVANGLGNLFNAHWGRSPVVLTAGNQTTKQIFQEPMLAADLVRMTEQFCKWAYEVKRAEDVGPALRRAFKVAASPPTGPVFVSIPWDYLDEGGEVELAPPSHIAHGMPGDPAAIAQAAQRLLDAERPMIMAGDEVGRAGAVAELVALAELVGARVVGEQLHSRLNFPMDHPLWQGMLAPTYTLVRPVLEQADVVFAIGATLFAPFFPSPVHPIPPEVELIHAHVDDYEIAKTFPVSLGIRGEVRATLQALVREIESRIKPGRESVLRRRGAEIGEQRAAAVASLRDAVTAQVSATPLPPIAACAQIVEALDGPASIVDEAVTNSYALRLNLRQRDPDSYFFFRGGGLGWGIPAAAGVKLAQPERQVVAVVGDGATLYVPQALWTLAHHDIPATIVILNNGGYYILKAQLLGMGGKAAKYERYPGMDIAEPAVDFMALAQAFGVPAERVEKGSEVAPAVRKALASGGPAVVEVPIDPTVRPLTG